MSWTTNANGEMVYNGSVYNDSIIPTWEEINVYMQYMHGKTDLSSVTDLYFDRPMASVLEVKICNQLNKLIHEDMVGVKLRNQYAEYTDFKPYFYIIRFDTDNEDIHLAMINAVEGGLIPPVFEIHNRQGHYNVFQTEHQFVDLTDDLPDIELCACIAKRGDSSFIIDLDDTDIIDIRNQLFDRVKKYYEEPIGWKGVK